MQGLGHLGLTGDDVGFRFKDGGLIGGISGYGSIVLLLGDNVLLDERGVALYVEVRFDSVGFGGSNASFGSLLLLARLIDGGG